ncbi:GNAT family N-acetyltransferase, partial [Staphylococcus pseudintermedius]
MAVYFKKTTLKNADFILEMQKQCFRNDFLEYEDYETSPYYETLEDLQN